MNTKRQKMKLNNKDMFVKTTQKFWKIIILDFGKIFTSSIIDFLKKIVLIENPFLVCCLRSKYI